MQQRSIHEISCPLDYLIMAWDQFLPRTNSRHLIVYGVKLWFFDVPVIWGEFVFDKNWFSAKVWTRCKIIQSCLNTISLVVFSELELFFIGSYSFSHLSHSWNIDIEKSERFNAKYNVPFCRRTLLTKIRVVLQCWKTERKSRLITK